MTLLGQVSCKNIPRLKYRPGNQFWEGPHVMWNSESLGLPYCKFSMPNCLGYVDLGPPNGFSNTVSRIMKGQGQSASAEPKLDQTVIHSTKIIKAREIGPIVILQDNSVG